MAKAEKTVGGNLYGLALNELVILYRAGKYKISEDPFCKEWGMNHACFFCHKTINGPHIHFEIPLTLKGEYISAVDMQNYRVHKECIKALA